MKITACELPDGGRGFEEGWTDLCNHIRTSGSELVLLPDMPFSGWFAGSQRFDSAVWQSAVRAHEEWEPRLRELGTTYVLSSRPVDFGNERWDEGFVWDAEHGLRSVHAKSQFRNEKGAWENTWYRSTWPEFVPLELEDVRIGFLIGAELAEEEEARRYGAERVDVIAIPRGACVMPFEGWLARGQALAQVGRAYVISSARSGAFGGQGCIIAPDGEVLGVTSATEPFITCNIDLGITGMRRSAPLDVTELRGQIDPWETGVPPY